MTCYSLLSKWKTLNIYMYVRKCFAVCHRSTNTNTSYCSNKNLTPLCYDRLFIIEHQQRTQSYKTWQKLPIQDWHKMVYFKTDNQQDAKCHNLPRKWKQKKKKTFHLFSLSFHYQLNYNKVNIKTNLILLSSHALIEEASLFHNCIARTVKCSFYRKYY